MDNSSFDQWLQEKLNRLQGEIPPADWTRMRAHLDEADWIDAQNEQAADFDQAIRQQLSNSPPPPPATNWDNMAQRLDQEFGPEHLDDIILDGVVYENLHRYQAPYNEDHWPIMEERLQDTYSIRRKLVKYKVAEIGLMLLLIFTLLQFLIHSPLKKNSAETATPESQPFVSSILTPGATAGSEQNTSSSTSTVAVPNNEASASKQSTVSKKGSTAAEGDQSSTTTQTKQTQDQLVSPIDREVSSISSYFTDPLKPIAYDVRDRNLQESKLLELRSGNILDFSDWQNLDLLAVSSIPEPVQLLPACLICPQASKRNSWQVGMVVATDMNYINPTEAEFRFRVPDYDEINYGYGGGLTVTIPVNKRWAFETGLIYASAYYLPKQINSSLVGSFRNGFFAVGFQSAQLHLVKLPLQAQYAFNPDNSRWRWYGIMGASVNATLIQEYYYRSIPEPSFSGNTSTTRSSNLAAELADQYNGLIDGGQTDDNLQLTANIGVGVERFFSPRWSIFIQPVYQHDLRLPSLQGFGPYQDRINSLSFYFGSKVTLK